MLKLHFDFAFLWCIGVSALINHCVYNRQLCYNLQLNLLGVLATLCWISMDFFDWTLCFTNPICVSVTLNCIFVKMKIMMILMMMMMMCVYFNWSLCFSSPRTVFQKPRAPSNCLLHSDRMLRLIMQNTKYNTQKHKFNLWNTSEPPAKRDCHLYSNIIYVKQCKIQNQNI